MRRAYASAAAALYGCALLLSLLAGCAGTAATVPAAVENRSVGAGRTWPASVSASAATPAAPTDTARAAPAARSGAPARTATGTGAGTGAGTAAVDPAKARWTPTEWSELPGWADDRSAEIWPALREGCTRPAPGWNELCARVLLEPAPAGDDVARLWLTTHLQPWRISAADGSTEGLATGYFEPSLEASRTASARFRVPLFAPPAELLAQAQGAPRRPYYTRQQLDSLPAARAALRGLEIAWIEDPLDALMLQVQGSGRLRFVEPDGRPGGVQQVRMAFAAHNGQPFGSLGRWLIEQGEPAADSASWPAIKAWARRHPRRVQELLWANPRVVFFREEPLPNPDLGPRGALGVPLTPMRSAAVDPLAVPHGALLWIDTSEPGSNTPLRRVVAAQDSGGAILGAPRIDLFFGWASGAEMQAGRMKQPLRLWALWPRGHSPLAEP